MLKIGNLHAYYGAIEALKGVNIAVGEDAIVCIIGANGAGKTTLLNAISGAVTRTGSIAFNGQEIGSLSSVKIAKMGISHVPEGRHVFPGLTVMQNLEVGTVPWHGFFGPMNYGEDLEKVFTLFPRLKEREKQLAFSLSGGEQQMLAIGRALMSRPKMLLLDEPSMGLAPLVVMELFEKIVEINKQGLPMLLVEQNARVALKVSRYGYVIRQGEIVIEGESEVLRTDKRIAKAYIGVFEDEGTIERDTEAIV
ncbi:MAG: ABC transporter ATP-binding protein [Peptococcaceae bacterium]|nr:ABC transporter ATP-binding protein [Peptococcaceae bacterium]